jgi:cytoplasmic tRNA 2-thiolation protein 1
MPDCAVCGQRRASLRRPKTSQPICRPCFFHVFETEIHQTIVEHQLFKPGERVALGASGGKDSTVLAYVMKLLNDRYEYGLDLVLLSIDEGITGYRDHSLDTVHQNSRDYALPLTVLSYADLYGWSMDQIVKQIGLKNNCTFCGVFRRQAMERGCQMLGATKMVTGHNADDVAETVLMNVLRGDIGRLGRWMSGDHHDGGGGCGTNEQTSSPSQQQPAAAVPRIKPFIYTYEKEIVLYAHYKQLVYFSTECTYSPNAYRGFARVFIKDLERLRPSAILDLVHSGERLAKAVQQRDKAIRSGAQDGARPPVQTECVRCGFLASQSVCKACLLLENLNRGLPKLGLTRSKAQVSRVAGDKYDVAVDSAAEKLKTLEF